jgi:hypothetical protein
MTDVLKFAWTHGVYQVEHYSGQDALDDAIRDADGASDADLESLAHIEVWEDGALVRVLEPEEVFSEAAKFRPELPYPEPMKAALKIRDRDGNWARGDAFRTRDDAADHALKLAGLFGGDRVQVERLGRIGG